MAVSATIWTASAKKTSNGVNMKRQCMLNTKPRCVKGRASEVGEEIIVDNVQFIYDRLFQVDFYFKSGSNVRKRMFIEKELIDSAIVAALAAQEGRDGE